MKLTALLPVVAAFAAFPALGAAQEPAASPAPPTAKANDFAIGVISSPTPAQAKSLALNWLKEQPGGDALLPQAEAVWADEGQAVLERLVRTFALAKPETAKLLAELRDEKSPRPIEMPAVLKAAKPGLFRANVGLAAAKALVDRRLYEEALAILRATQPEQVVDPSSYYFSRAVCENRLLLKEDGMKSIHRLLVSVPDAPERHKAVAALMQDEMEKWEDQDLAYVARRMQEIEGRLDNGRGGPKTQEKQKEVVDLLDKMIEDLESQCQNAAAGAGSSSAKNTMPLPDSQIMQNAGPGNVDKKKLAKDAKNWGAMPEKEKVKALEALSRGYPPHYKEAIEGFTKKVAEGGKP